MPVFFLVDSDSSERLCQLMQRLDEVEVTLGVDRALSYVEETGLERPVILRRRVTASTGADLIERLRWIRPNVTVCIVTDSPLL
ncbi:MAG: hypothetical protein AAFX50_19055, partial [Acidobacteriota bacterium]